ncbi:MAG: MBL fold metallo-hydrolase [Myxococcota bacterium]|nr:MBL fold metallo-hydrolase [Myxococcota bacterium]
MSRVLLLVLFAACGSSSPSQPKDDAQATGDGPPPNPDAPPGGLVPGTLAVSWMHGSQNCAANTDPEVQVHMYNASTIIIRQNKCRTFEAPFIYVLVGTTSALMLDTGGTNTVTLRDTVRGLIGAKPLLVAHSHAHGDHTASDSRFSGQANTTLVAVTRAAVQATFGITTWPTSVGTYELGGRTLDILGIPGHEAQHIAIYDRQTGLLLTGDTLYPGLLFINDWATYRTTIGRLAQFVGSHPISYVLGAHIEMTSTPKQVYPYGTTYQPAEHVLQLTAAHVTQLDAQLTQLGATPPAQPVALDDFIIDPQ